MATQQPSFLRLACFVRALFLVLRLDRLDQITGDGIKAAVAQDSANVRGILGASKRLLIANISDVDESAARRINDEILAWVRSERSEVVHRQLAEAHRRSGASVAERNKPQPPVLPPGQQNDQRQPAAARSSDGPRVELIVPAKVTIQDGAAKTISVQVALGGLLEKTRIPKIHLRVVGNFGGELSKTQGEDAFDAHSHTSEAELSIPADFEGPATVQAWVRIPGTAEPITSGSFKMEVVRIRAEKPAPAVPPPIPDPLLLASALRLAITGQQKITLEEGEESAIALVVALHGTLPAGVALGDMSMVLYDRAGVACQGRFEPTTRTVTVRINIGENEEGTYTFRACANTHRAADVLWADPFEVTLVRKPLELEPDPVEPTTDFSKAELRLTLPSSLTAVRGQPAQVMVHVAYYGPRPAGGCTALPRVVVRAVDLNLPVSDVEIRFEEDNPRTYGQISIPEGIEGEVTFVAELYGHLVESDAATVDLSWVHPRVPRHAGVPPAPVAAVIDIPADADPDPVPAPQGLPERMRVTVHQVLNGGGDLLTLGVQLEDVSGNRPVEPATFRMSIRRMVEANGKWKELKGVQSQTVQVPGELTVTRTRDRSVQLTFPDYPKVVFDSEEIALDMQPITKEGGLGKMHRFGRGLRGFLGSLIEQGAPPPHRPNPVIQRAQRLLGEVIQTTPQGEAMLAAERDARARAQRRYELQLAVTRAAEAVKAEAEAKAAAARQQKAKNQGGKGRKPGKPEEEPYSSSD